MPSNHPFQPHSPTPFGSVMLGRDFRGGKYRYGFNTQEKVTELGGDIYTAEFWMYNAQLGRRWNVDPVVKIWESSYACFFNNPILVTDVKGDDGKDPPYKVKRGDNLWNIAKKNGTSVEKILELNKDIKDKTKIYPGQSINLSIEAKNTKSINTTNFDQITLSDNLKSHTQINPSVKVNLPSYKRTDDASDDFSLSRMYKHFQIGGGKTINVNMSSINLDGATQKNLGLSNMSPNDIRSVNLFDAGSTNEIALAFGRVNMKCHGNSQFSIISDKSSRFDFNPIIDTKASLGRNVGNLGGIYINYNLYTPLGPILPFVFGGPFDVNFIGTKYIPK